MEHHELCAPLFSYPFVIAIASVVAAYSVTVALYVVAFCSYQAHSRIFVNMYIYVYGSNRFTAVLCKLVEKLAIAKCKERARGHFIDNITYRQSNRSTDI